MALTRVIYIARSHQEVERELSAALDELIEVCRAPRFSHDDATGVAERLVDLGLRQPECFSCSVDILGSGLRKLPELADVDGFDTRLRWLLGAMAKGFAAGLRDKLFDEQEGLTRALIRARENTERALVASEARFEEIFSSSSVGMAISDIDGTLIKTNRALADILEYRSGRVEARTIEELFHPEDAEYLGLRYQVLLEDDSLPFRERRRLLRQGGEEALVFLSASVLRDHNGIPRFFVTSAEDVSDKHHLEGQLQFQATHDALTGLVNRHRFIGKLEEALQGRAAADDITVFHLDLDGFHVINDGLGRDAGDRLLQVVAGRLREAMMDEEATIARLEGDEFAILLENSPTTPSISTIATRINDELAEPIYLGDDGIAATATIAVLHQPTATFSPAEILRATSITLHRLKSGGRRQWGMVDVAENERDTERYSLAGSLPGAWESGEIELDYQPLLSVVDRKVVAVQALLRWDHGQRGPIDHGRVLKALSETGLGLPIGRWMLGRAAEQVKSWSDRFDGALPKLYVELAREIAGDPDLVATVQAVLSDAGLSADQLQLGMPVQALCMLDGLAEDNLDVLVDLGVSVVLYDFGTTRGDLACLEDLQVSAVKMASNVVSRVSRDEGLFTRAIRSLVPLVREDTPVIVGDIATEAQLSWWCAVGVDTVQGPHLGAAGPPQNAEPLFVA